MASCCCIWKRVLSSVRSDWYRGLIGTIISQILIECGRVLRQPDLEFFSKIWSGARPSMASTPAVGSVVKRLLFKRRRSHLLQRWSAYFWPQLIWEGVGSRQAGSRHECNYPPLPCRWNLLLALVVSLIFCKVLKLFVIRHFRHHTHRPGPISCTNSPSIQILNVVLFCGVELRAPRRRYLLWWIYGRHSHGVV